MRLLLAILACNRRRLRLMVLVIACGCPLIASAASVDVELTDGNIVTGEVDAQTDAERLWLRREETGVELSSGYAWSQVQAVYQGQRQLTGPEFSETIGALKTPGKSVLDIEPAMIPVVADPTAANDCRVNVSRPRVESLRIEAQLARWGSAAATDGLRIFVFPLAADGSLVPVRGQLDLKLFGELRNARGGEYTVLRPEFHELESTGEIVRIQDFAGGPAVYELPFRRFHPDVDFEVATSAVVHARLGIPGLGVFEASADCVPLRNFSPIRDQLQLYEGRRFFRGENVYLRPRLPR